MNGCRRNGEFPWLPRVPHEIQVRTRDASAMPRKHKAPKISEIPTPAPPKSRVHEVVCRNLGRHPPLGERVTLVLGTTCDPCLWLTHTGSRTLGRWLCPQSRPHVAHPWKQAILPVIRRFTGTFPVSDIVHLASAAKLRAPLVPSLQIPVAPNRPITGTVTGG